MVSLKNSEAFIIITTTTNNNIILTRVQTIICSWEEWQQKSMTIIVFLYAAIRQCILHKAHHQMSSL